MLGLQLLDTMLISVSILFYYKFKRVLEVIKLSASKTSVTAAIRDMNTILSTLYNY